MAWLHRHVAELHAYIGLAFVAVGAGLYYLPLGLVSLGVGLFYLAHRVMPPLESSDTTVTDTKIRRVS